MPATITASLLLSLVLLPRGAGTEGGSSAGVNRASIAVTSITAIHTPPIQGDCSWVISEADLDEDESEDGDFHGRSAEADWVLPLPRLLAQVSTIRADPSLGSSAIRSPILRC